MPDIHELDMQLAEVGRTIGHLQGAGDPVPETLLMESAEIEMAMEMAASLN